VILPTRRLRHLAAAGLIAAAASVSVSAIAEPATASAAPREWDIGAYDTCITNLLDQIQKGNIDEKNFISAKQFCCEDSGGVWNGHDCVAPPANPAQAPGNVPTQTFQPAPPPVRNPGSVNPTVTFAPAG
jgi:hypothetical protein